MRIESRTSNTCVADAGVESDVHIVAARLNGGHRKKQKNVIAKSWEARKCASQLFVPLRRLLPLRQSSISASCLRIAPVAALIS